MSGKPSKNASNHQAGRSRNSRPAIFRISFKLLGLVALLPILLSGCLPEATPQPTPTITPTATQTPTPTATIVWFPPTATWTPMPVQPLQPTQDMRPALGKTLLEDPFTNLTLWQTMRGEAGSVAYGTQELTLAVSTPKGVLQSLRKTPMLDDFYLEIDAEPSLCRPNDVYGLLLRASSGLDYYRLLVNCNGQLRLERVKNGRSTTLQDWMISGEIRPGGLGTTRLGFWAAGAELRVFIEGVFQFAAKDPTFQAGNIGVFARSSGDTPLTVSFSNLVISSVESGRVPTPAPTRTVTVSPTATRRPTATPKP